MHSHLYKHFRDNNILYRKQFGFQKKLSIEHAIMQLVGQINSSFEKKIIHEVFLSTFQKLSAMLTKAIKAILKIVNNSLHMKIF